MMQYTKTEKNKDLDILSEAKQVFDIEIAALKKTRDALDKSFEDILKLIVSCEGKIIITGMGKPGHIGAKIAATFSSLGTSSVFVHPAEAMHGDLGMITANDVVIAISYSGESDEIIRILPNIKLIGAALIGITGNKNSTLAKYVDVLQVLPDFKEACNIGLAPTSSTTVELCYGDALAVVASIIYGFEDVDFGIFHPAGSLGKKLLITVDDLMAGNEKNAKINEQAMLKDAIVELSRKGLGVVSVVDTDTNLKGIITDGDLRRMLEIESNIYELKVKDIMTKKPITIQSGKLAIEALNILKEKNISCIPVLKNSKLIGTIRIQDIIGVGIVG